MFRSARLKLTLAYTLGIALIMAAFSVALYVALAGSIDVTGAASETADQAIQAAQLSRIRLVLLAINIAGWVIAAAVSYLVAGRSLRPIATAIARQREFTAHASHELRTPLTVMKGEVGVTLGRSRSQAEYEETLRRIDAEVAHLEDMVADLLDLAELEGGGAALDRDRRRVRDALREAVDSFSPRISERGIDFAVDAPASLDASLDWRRIRHLVGNLLENAIRHTPAAGRIRVTGRQRGKDLELVVSNTGSTIAENDLPHLFLPFYRGKGGTSDGGTGLGLALCDWVARAHGGSIAAQNDPTGVSFVVRLPRG